MKKIILVSGVIVTLIAVLIVTIQLLPRPYNLAYPKYRMLEYEGKKLYFNVYKYDPPYIPQYFLKSKEEQDLSTPEGTNLAVTCSSARDREWYLSLITEDYKKKMLEWGWKLNEGPFSEDLKNSPFVFSKSRGRYTYKIEFIFDGKKYVKIIEKHQIVNGEKIKYGQSCSGFMQKGDVWLIEYAFNFYPSTVLENLGYDELLKISKPAKLSSVDRFKRWLEYTKLKIHYLKNKR